MIAITLCLLLFAPPPSNGYDKHHSPLYEFERTLKRPDAYRKHAVCLKNLGRCDVDGFVMKGILYDVLNHNDYEYTELEKEPVIDTLRYMRAKYPTDYQTVMTIYDRKRTIRI